MAEPEARTDPFDDNISDAGAVSPCVRRSRRTSGGPNGIADEHRRHYPHNDQLKVCTYTQCIRNGG